MYISTTQCTRQVSLITFLKTKRQPHKTKKRQQFAVLMSGKRGSNSRPQPWQGCALPTELFPHLHDALCFARLAKVGTLFLLGQGVLYQLSYFRINFINSAFSAALIA